MRLSHFSVKRPVFTVMVTLIVLILGGVSLVRLPIDLMPDITYPTLTVRTSYENASPEEVERLVSQPIERAMSAVTGVSEVSSTSSEGMSVVRVTFTWGTDIAEGANDVRERLDRVIGMLPDNADRPVLLKFDMASFPVLIIGASSRLDPIQLRRIIDDQVKYRIERLPGVAALDVWGGLEREIHVNLLPDKITALGLPLDQIINNIRAANINLPAGFIDQGNYEVTVRTPGDYEDLHQLADTIVAMRQGTPVRLRDISDVQDAWQRVRRISRVDGEPGIRLAVRKQSGTNTVEVARVALEEIERINSDIPQIRIVPIIDTSDYIKRSISNVSTAALYGGMLAILILLVFLRNIRSTIIIGITIPISIIATFALIYFSGFTLNIMTLGGLALGIGMLVDNAIVVLENIFRQREAGETPELAAIKGSEEVTAAIIASTLTTMVVFLPMVFMGGMTGVMFKQLALVVAFALLCSLAAAITLVPTFAAKLLKAKPADESRKSLTGKVFKFSGAILASIENDYKSLLTIALRHRVVVVFSAIVLLVGSLSLIPLVGVEFMPDSDEGEVQINAEMETGTRIDIFNRKLLEIEQIVEDSVPEIQNMVSNVGGGGWRPGGVHAGSVRVSLVPLNERTRSSAEVAAELRQRMSNIPGVTVRVRAGEGMLMRRLMGRQDGEKVDIEIRGYDLNVADELARRVEQMLMNIEGVTDVRVSREMGTPEEQVVIDRQKAEDLGLSVRQIAQVQQTLLSGTRAGYYREGGEEYTILVKMKDAERAGLDELLNFQIINNAGQPVMLRNVVRVEPRRGPILIERRDQERIITVSANVADRDLGSVINDVNEGLHEIPIPRDFSIHLAGDYEEQANSFRELLMTLVLALVLVYMVMAAQYESLRDPFVVMFSVPLAIIGVTVMLFITGTTFNVQSFIGCIMLGGIVVNNAILLVDHTNLLRRRDGMPLFDAITEAGRRRLRPILMTSLTTILGLTPLALGIGEGGEAQAPMARAVIGGLISSTLITLVFVPVIYSLFERKDCGHSISEESAE